MTRAFIFAALLSAAGVAEAHDWYPMECCSGMDCAPVEKVEILPLQSAGIMGSNMSLPGTMMITTKHGTVIVPANFPRRESKDNQMHACMRAAPGGNMRLICLFIPPST
jgi:hypothetical protein